MDNSREQENLRIMEIAQDERLKNEFLSMEQTHILRLTSKVLKKSVTTSDDEWSVALLAVSQAMDHYDIDKGDFWNYAALVIRSRIFDEYRKRKKGEVLVSPDVFSGGVDQDDPEVGIQNEIQQKYVKEADIQEQKALQDEILLLTEELQDYHISFFELAMNTPKADKTKNVCREIIRAIFLPPPLMAEIRKTKTLPVKEILKRYHFSRKISDRYRKYLITVALILDGDYPGLNEYVSCYR
ncbi:MAG: hypothetical protein IJ079_00800 [Lachnospiraceae bacterium]|nr:hypothetical protein [Lachnospiraceae bacterium]